MTVPRYATFAELYPYCYRVASAVGLSCIAIWGCHDPSAKQPAEEAGIAFQLTNILRDLGEDCERGRVYLPTEDWQRFGCPPEQWPLRNEAFREMMHFEVARVRDYYQRSEALIPLLPRPGRTMFRVMSATYRELLRRIESSDFDVIHKRQRVPTWKKLSIFARMWMTD